VKPAPSVLFIVIATLGVGAAHLLASTQGPLLPSAAAALPADLDAVGFRRTSAVQGVHVLVAERAFRLPLAQGPVTGQPPSAQDQASARALLERELARYPRGLLSAAGLRGIVLLQGLREGTQAIPSLPNVTGLMLLDVNAPMGTVVWTLHHEIYHFADLADDGQLTHDPAWIALTPGFSYGGGGRSMRVIWAAGPGSAPSGFVTGYATSGPEEDKAETFAAVMAGDAALRHKLQQDPVLRAKVSMLGHRLDSLAPGSRALVTAP
jgi:hypothetical protein